MAAGALIAVLLDPSSAWQQTASANTVAMNTAPGGMGGLPGYVRRLPPKPPPPAGTNWFTVGVGATGLTEMVLGDPDAVNEPIPLDGTELTESLMQMQTQGEALSLSLGFHHRFRYIDLGLAITHQASSSVNLFDVDRRMPGYAQAQGTFRWRFFERHWGGLYGGFGLGGFIARPTRGFRASVAFQFEGQPQLDFTDERMTGGSVSSKLGLMLYHGESVGFFVEGVNNFCFGSYRVGDDELPFVVLDTLMSAGVSWSL